MEKYKQGDIVYVYGQKLEVAEVHSDWVGLHGNIDSGFDYVRVNITQIKPVIRCNHETKKANRSAVDTAIGSYSKRI